MDDGKAKRLDRQELNNQYKSLVNNY